LIIAQFTTTFQNRRLFGQSSQDTVIVFGIIISNLLFTLTNTSCVIIAGCNLSSSILNSTFSLLECGLLEFFEIFVTFTAHHAALEHEIGEHFGRLEQDVKSIHGGQSFVRFVLVSKGFSKLFSLFLFFFELLALLTRLFFISII
jgi:hypothetical protein